MAVCERPSLGWRLWLHRGEVAVLPDMPGEGLDAGHVALGVEADGAEHGVELPVVQRVADRRGLKEPAFSTAWAQAWMAA